jgi:hypothetical protein
MLYIMSLKKVSSFYDVSLFRKSPRTKRNFLVGLPLHLANNISITQTPQQQWHQKEREPIKEPRGRIRGREKERVIQRRKEGKSRAHSRLMFGIFWYVPPPRIDLRVELMDYSARNMGKRKKRWRN